MNVHRVLFRVFNPYDPMQQPYPDGSIPALEGVAPHSTFEISTSPGSTSFFSTKERPSVRFIGPCPLSLFVVVFFFKYVSELMQAHGVRIYAAEGGAGLSHFDADWTSPSALVVGAEARGLGDSARRGLDSGQVVGVSVPLAGGVESLNAAVAGAVVLGEAQRQRAMSERAGATRGGAGITAQ